MFKYILPAAALSLMTLSSAWALPPAQSNTVQTDTNLIEVQQRHHRSDRHHRFNRSHRSERRMHSGRYSHGGRHWRHRYHARPSDWRTRGCIMAGPLWFCP